ncbi:YiiD C-terminal domain-containing protein [Marinicella sp. W31]|uniref:YiiD C-terminal domain-containing protein n=1 Tax=Marinicella sp. W31 TaxID=3023713 RepID=UPI003756D8B6
MNTSARPQSDASRLREFQLFLYRHIPLTESMQLRLDAYTGQELQISAPLAPNINDKGTAFGGSASTLKIICGWSLLKLNLIDLSMPHDIVISKSTCRWHKPLSDALSAHARFKTDTSWDDFIEKFKKSNRNMSIPLQVEIHDARGEICSSMQASYAIIQPNS